MKKIKSGKVRDIYEQDGKFIIVTSDRISAFDHILPTPIPERGKILTQVTKFWLELLDVPNHLVSTDLKDVGWDAVLDADKFRDRTMVVRKCNPILYECVVRGHIDGSMWKVYEKSGRYLNYNLPAGLQRCQKLDRPIFTPATKAQTGHDINITYEDMAARCKQADLLKRISIYMYERAYAHALQRGIIIADTKFEFGHDLVTGELLLIDEVLTPDSCRFWDRDAFEVGKSQPSMDKQIVRDWLAENWHEDEDDELPEMPQDVVERVSNQYRVVANKLMDISF